MARTPKPTVSAIRKATRRTTWTEFRLPVYRQWPQWRDAKTVAAMSWDPSAWDVHDMTLKDFYHGPLAKADGIIRVRLGRKVKIERRQFSLPVSRHPSSSGVPCLTRPATNTPCSVWESAEHLRAFQESPGCAVFLRGLGLPEDGSSSPFAISLQYSRGFDIGEQSRYPDGLNGRITLTITDVPVSNLDDEDRDGWNVPIFKQLSRLYWPKDFDQSLIGPRAIQWTCHTFATNDYGPEKGPIGVCYSFRRWNINGVTHESEEASFKEPESQELLARGISELVPPVKSWRQERWDIDLAPCCRALCGLDGLEWTDAKD